MVLHQLGWTLVVADWADLKKAFVLSHLDLKSFKKFDSVLTPNLKIQI